MKEHQTPHKASARSAEKRTCRFKDFPSKKANKIANKNLNSAFSSVSEDPVDLSLISEITHVNGNEDVSSFLLEEPSSVTLLPSDITPSKNSTDRTGISSTNSFGVSELECSDFASVEAEIVLNFLKKVKPEVLTSVNPQYTKLMDEIIEYVINDHNSNTEQEETDRFAQVLSAKNRLLFLCGFLWFIGVLVVLFSYTSDTYGGPLPT